MNEIEFVIVVLLAAAILVRLADFVSIPYPIVLVIGGTAIGFIPGAPDVEIEPELILLVFLPPLLHAAGFYASPQELKTAAGELFSLTLALVLVTMCGVAVVAHALVDGLSWEAAFVLGAIIAPTDPVTAAATFSRLGVPDVVRRTVEGEAMLNDASALVAYRVAVAALVSGSFAAGDAALDFAGSVVGGIAVGLLVGVAGQRIQHRLQDVPLAIFLSVLFAYGAYVGAEELLHASGVLATVTAGMWFGWHSHSMFDADTRLNAIAFWEVLEFALNATLFILLGLQLGEVTGDLGSVASTGELLGYVAAVGLTVIGIRMVWVFLSLIIGRVLPGSVGSVSDTDWRERVAIGWSGMRGAISLAAVLAVPATLENGTEFAERDLIIFITSGVIVMTLVGQGLTLPLVIKALKLEAERIWSPDEAIARLEAAQAALDRLEELEEDGEIPDERARRLRELYEARFKRCMAILGGDAEEGERHAHKPVRDYSALRRELITAERAALLELRDAGRLNAEVLRMIQRDLDLEEARLPT